jgi:hypothetical protein
VSLKTYGIEAAGDYFFAYFNDYGALTGLPDGSFNTANIEAAGDYFFVSFNYEGALTGLPEGSFKTTSITAVGDHFFAFFNSSGALTGLPDGSFNTTGIESAGDYFFAYFNSNGRLAAIPQSFKWPTAATIEGPNSFYYSFWSTTPITQGTATQIINGRAAPSTSRDTFSSVWPDYGSLDANWRG